MKLPEEGGGRARTDSEIDRLRAELDHERDSVRRMSALVETITEEKRVAAEAAADIQRQLHFVEEHARDLEAQLAETRDSPAWHIIHRLTHNDLVGGLWKTAKAMFPTWMRQEIKGWIRRKGNPGDSPKDSATSVDNQTALAAAETLSAQGLAFSDFLSRINESNTENLVMFVAGAKFLEAEGQRVSQLIRAMIRDDVAVILIYHRWRSEYHQPVPKPIHHLLIQLPMDLFDQHSEHILNCAYRSSLNKTCIFEFPHPHAIAWEKQFRSAGWATIYDVIDDWEEFHKAGKALWYKPGVERSLCQACNAVTAVSKPLAEKVAAWVPAREVRLVANGVSLESFDLTRAAQPLLRGQITVGYFGFLTSAWFDWKLIAEVATRRPDWEFHIVGFGEPAPAGLPVNVRLLGRVPHYLLNTYALNWDVSMIPFRSNPISRCADPIKVYEYLALGLPVVAVNIPHLREYPGVHVAESAEEFERLLERAATEELNHAAVASFLAQSTWLHRAHKLLEAGRPEN